MHTYASLIAVWLALGSVFAGPARADNNSTTTEVYYAPPIAFRVVLKNVSPRDLNVTVHATDGSSWTAAVNAGESYQSRSFPHPHKDFDTARYASRLEGRDQRTGALFTWAGLEGRIVKDGSAQMSAWAAHHGGKMAGAEKRTRIVEYVLMTVGPGKLPAPVAVPQVPAVPPASYSYFSPSMPDAAPSAPPLDSNPFQSPPDSTMPDTMPAAPDEPPVDSRTQMRNDLREIASDIAEIVRAGQERKQRREAERRARDEAERAEAARQEELRLAKQAAEAERQANTFEAGEHGKAMRWRSYRKLHPDRFAALAAETESIRVLMEKADRILGPE